MIIILPIAISISIILGTFVATNFGNSFLIIGIFISWCILNMVFMFLIVNRMTFKSSSINSNIEQIAFLERLKYFKDNK